MLAAAVCARWFCAAAVGGANESWRPELIHPGGIRVRLAVPAKESALFQEHPSPHTRP